MKTRIASWDCAVPDAGIGEGAKAAELLMDNEIFGGFYRRTARQLWAYLARVSGNAALADDLVQESYLRLLSATFTADGEEACRRYLYRIATNLLRDHWRRPAMSSLEDLPDGALRAGPTRISEQMDSRTLVDRAFLHMRPRERQLLWLAYAEGSSHREIAEITGLGVTSIRLLLFRARHKLARQLRRLNGKSGGSI
jgi:RNA polymerase sigma-70 factor (ECF subfamily)